MSHFFFDQYRKKHTGIHQNFIGELNSFIYGWGPYYFRTDFAFSYIKERFNGITTFSGTETDDILFTFGRDIPLKSPEKTLTLSFLFGIPTHGIKRLRHIDLGYGQVGIGGQLDGSYQFNPRDTVIYGTRYIYFIPGKAKDIVQNNYTFSIGNVNDFLLAYKNNWDVHHGAEFGYTSRFRYGAKIDPNLDEVLKRTNYIRSNFYATYKYKFMINSISNRLLFYISYGFDHSPKQFGNKYIVTLWTSWNVNF